MRWEDILVRMARKKSVGMTKKKEILLGYYKDSWEYIKESKNYIYFAAFIFLIFTILGFILPIFFVDIIKDQIANIINQTEGLDTLSLIGFIFLNNAKTSFLGLVLGILFGFIPIILAVINGYVLGFVSNYAVGEAGYTSLFRLLPHGIFELPAVIIGLGLGTKLGMFFFSKDSNKEFMRRVWLSLKVFIFIVVPLLVISAIIEGSLIGLLN
jgi:stage II sporulation protein M